MMSVTGLMSGSIVTPETGKMRIMGLATAMQGRRQVKFEELFARKPAG